MKKGVWGIVLLAALMLGLLSACSTVQIQEGQEAGFTYRYGEQDISATLSQEESAEIAQILQGKSCHYEGYSCGFSSDISITLDGQCFYLASDACPVMQNAANGKFIRLTEGERTRIEDIFMKYGVVFPW